MILLRHGQSEFNLHHDRTGGDPGIVDAPLTPLGHAQAERAAESLQSQAIRRILCSPLTRALQTAAPISRRLDIPVVVTAAIRERRSASCDIGTCRTDLASAWPHLDLSQLDEIWWHAQEEPHDVFGARVTAFEASVAASDDWAHTLVICHWGVIMALTGRSVMNGEWLRCPSPDDRSRRQG